MHRRAYRRLVPVAAIAALGLAGCATRASLPPVAPSATDLTHPGKFVWFDLLTEGVCAARRTRAPALPDGHHGETLVP